MKLTKWQEWGIIAGLLILILPYIILFFYAHPQSDDYSFAILRNDLDVFAFVKHLYLTWSGRYFAMFLGALNPWVYKSVLGYQISLLFYFLIFYSSIHFFLKSLLNNSINKRKLHIFSLFSLFLFMQTSPDLYEIFYWYPGVSAYQISFSVFLLFLAQILRFVNNAITKPIFIIAIILLSFILAGLSELFIPIMIFTFTYFIVFYKHWAITKRRAMIFAFSIYFLFSLLFLISPGNLERLNVASVSNSFSTILNYSLKSYLLINFNFIQNPVFIIALLTLLLLIINPLQNSKNISLPKVINPIYLIAVSHLLIFTFISFLIPLIKEVPSGRIFNIIGFVYIITTVLNILNIALYLKKEKPVLYNIPNWIFSMLVSILLIFTLTGIYPISTSKFLNAPNSQKSKHIIITSNYTNAIYTVFYDAESFKKDYESWDNHLINSQKLGLKTDTISALPIHSKIIFRSYDYTYSNTWIKNWETSFYGLDSLYLKPLTPNP